MDGWPLPFDIGKHTMVEIIKIAGGMLCPFYD